MVAAGEIAFETRDFSLRRTSLRVKFPANRENNREFYKN
jgi:hypothetical protein